MLLFLLFSFLSTGVYRHPSHVIAGHASPERGSLGSVHVSPVYHAYDRKVR
jgi:hypothetical protein